MKKYLFTALALIGANAFSTSAQAADTCPNLFLTNATGSSPRVVQGGTVNFIANGYAPAIDIYLNGSHAALIIENFLPAGTPFFSPASLTGIPVGSHTLRNGIETCEINFNVVPIPPNPTMTGGWTSWQTGEGHTATITHLYGFDKDWFGSMNPTTTTNGKPYEALYDQHVCMITGCGVASSLSISGWTSDPGKLWLNSVSAHGKTKTAAASLYSYSNGTASWYWNDGVPFGFAAGGSTLITMSHN